jgi:hypothetical protein
VYCFTTIPRAAASGSKRHSGQLTRKFCQISTEKRPNQTLLVIGQLVVGLLLGGVAVSEGALSELRSRVAGFCVLASHFVKATANSLFLRVFVAYSLTADASGRIETMNAVITLGIDMSSQPKGTAACAVTWQADRAVAVTPWLGCDDEMLSEMIAKSHAVGIDAPFGWPAEFAVAVGAWSFTFWTPQLRERLCFREDRSSCARNRGTLAAERLCGSDRAAGDAYIRAVGPPWSYGSQQRQQVLRGLSSRQFEPVGG